MKTIDEIRVENLHYLAVKNGGVVELAKRLEKVDNQLRQLLGRHKGIGSNIAREVEAKLGLDRGWMDHEQVSDSGAIGAPTTIDRVVEIMRAMEPEAQYLVARIVEQVADTRSRNHADRPEGLVSRQGSPPSQAVTDKKLVVRRR